MPDGMEILDSYSAITASLQFLPGVTPTKYQAQAIYRRGHKKKPSLNPHRLRPGSFPAPVSAWCEALEAGWVAAQGKNPSLV